MKFSKNRLILLLKIVEVKKLDKLMGTLGVVRQVIQYLEV